MHDCNDKVHTNICGDSEGEHVTVHMTTMTKYTQITVETSDGEHITVRTTTMTQYTQTTELWRPVKVNTSLYVQLQ